MQKKKRRFSYTGHKNQRSRIGWIIPKILVFVLLYASLTSVFFSVVVLESDSMAENLRAGERFVFLSYNFHTVVPWLNLERESVPFRRGNVVMVEMFREEEPNIFFNILDGVVRFLTFQRLSLIDQREHLFVKRVIGLPGDEISMANFVARVTVKGSPYNLTEFEVTERDYTPAIPRLPVIWDSSLPFSGELDAVVLGDNETFLLSDDRSNTNDSRTWGPVPVRNITGRAIFRYWPLNRLGRI